MQLNFLQEEIFPAASELAPTPKPVRTTHSKQEIQPSLLPDDVPPAPRKAVRREREITAPPTAAADTDSPEKTDGDLKSPSAFKTIREASEILGVPAYVLRFWESQFPQIRPTKSRGGRRYYRPEDMAVLAHIQSLLYRQGYTIKGARKALAEQPHPNPVEDALLAPVAAIPPSKPLITAKQKNQLSAIRSELLGLREQLLPYL